MPNKKTAAKKPARKPAKTPQKKPAARRLMLPPATAKRPRPKPLRQSAAAAAAADWLPAAAPIRELMQTRLWPKQITIGKRHRKEFGDLAALAADIDERGLLQPIVVDRGNHLIAGERRLRAWPLTKFAGEPIPAHIVPLKDIVAGEWAENDPALRRDFTLSEAVAIKHAIEAKLKPAAAERKRAGVKGAAGKEKSGDKAAAFTGKSRRTLEKAEAIVAAAKAEPQKYGALKAAMDKSGRVDGPYKRLKTMQAAAEIRNAPAPLPDNGPYRGAVIDFPWAAEPEDDDPERLARGYYPYPTMAVVQCADFAREHIKPRLHADCMVALWITNFHLVKGHHLPIVAALGGNAVTLLTGDKDLIGRGQVARGQTEHVVLIRVGDPTVEGFASTRFAFAVDRKNHSRKPQNFYDDFARAVPAERYASFFETAPRGDKWDCHGAKMAAAARRQIDLEELLVTDAEAPDELAVLEWAGADAPDGLVRSFPQELLDKLAADKLITGKHTKRITKAGRARLAALREERAEQEALAALPDDIEALIGEYLATLAQLDAAVTGPDFQPVPDTAIARRRAEAIRNFARRLDRLQAKANGGTTFGMATDDSPAERLRAETAAPIGTVPCWGQRGLFALDIDGVTYLVSANESIAIAVHAAAPGKPFISETGYKSLAHVPDFENYEGDEERVGRETVAQFAERLIRFEIAHEPVGSSGNIRPRKKPLPLPQCWYRLPTSWGEVGDSYGDMIDASEEAAEAAYASASSAAGGEPGRHPWLAVACPSCKARAGAWCKRPSGHKAMDLHAARGKAAPAVAAPRSRRDDEDAQAASVIAALTAEFPHGVAGHDLTMTIDWSAGVPGVSVATCQCGTAFRAARDLPMSGHDAIDAEVLAHWRAAHAAGVRHDAIDAEVLAHWRAAHAAGAAKKAEAAE